MINILAYLISAPVTVTQQASFHDRILLGSRTTGKGDEEHLKRFSEILLNLKKEDTVDALHKHLPFIWSAQERYDTTNPFGDARGDLYHTLWTFDTRNDVLRYTNASKSSQISLDVLRERVVSLIDMEPLGGPVPAPLDFVLDPEMSYWKPRVEVDYRMRAFSHSLLRDFHHQWRHILRNRYNSRTLKVLSRAIVRLSTLDFEVREDTGAADPQGAHVWPIHLPAWEPFDPTIVRVGIIWIVMCEDIRHGPSLVQQHIESKETGTIETLRDTGSGEARVNYMILSVRHIMLCHVTGRDSVKYTAPEPLFNGDYGTRSPSDLALDYVLWGTASARSSISTPIQSLPVEIQDMVINYTSSGIVLGAKIGCLLGLGSPFSWKHEDWTVMLERRAFRPTGHCVESQIWFGEHPSGIAYLARPREEASNQLDFHASNGRVWED